MNEKWIDGPFTITHLQSASEMELGIGSGGHSRLFCCLLFPLSSSNLLATLSAYSTMAHLHSTMRVLASVPGEQMWIEHEMVCKEE